MNIVDYLLKQFSFERLLKAVNKAITDTSKTTFTAENKTTDTKNQRIFLYTNNKHIQVLLDDILFIEASGNNVKIVLKEDIITLRGTLSSVMQLMPNEGFMQVHRSFIVAQKHIKIIEGNQIFIDKYVVPIGKYFKAQIDNLLT